MLDVIHYFFEEDMSPSSAEEAEARSQMRTVIYRNMYHKAYKFTFKSSGKSYNYSDNKMPNDGFYGEDLAPFDPDNQTTKPFVPATEFDPDSPLPFGLDLDAPLS